MCSFVKWLTHPDKGSLLKEKKDIYIYIYIYMDDFKNNVLGIGYILSNF